MDLREQQKITAEIERQKEILEAIEAHTKTGE